MCKSLSRVYTRFGSLSGVRNFPNPTYRGCGMSHQWILSKGSNRENPTPSFEDLQGSIFQIPHPLFRDLQGSIFEIPHPVSGIFADFQGSIVSRDLLGSTGSIGIYRDLQGSTGIFRDLQGSTDFSV